MSRLVRVIKEHGVSGLIARLPYFISSRIRKIFLYPTSLTRFGTTQSRWQKFQNDHELDFWNNPAKYDTLGDFDSFREKYFVRNKNKFRDIKLDFPNGLVVDVGCGPDGGFLPFTHAKYKVGIDPLAKEYAEKYVFDNDIIMIASTAEKIPMLSESIDACYCINALDHVVRPYQALNEIYRIMKKGAYFAFSVDTGGTKGHPVKIYGKDLDRFFREHPFQIIEKRCTTEGSPWGEEANVPLYVFQGYKL